MTLKKRILSLERWLAMRSPVGKGWLMRKLLKDCRVIYGLPDNDPPLDIDSLTDEELEEMWPKAIELLHEVYGSE